MENETPEIPEGVETVPVEAIVVGLKPFVHLEADPKAGLSIRWGGGIASKTQAAGLLAEVVARMLHDLDHEAGGHAHDEEPQA